MSMRGTRPGGGTLQGTIRRGFSRILNPLASSRSREEELQNEREFERLFLLFESFLHNDHNPIDSLSAEGDPEPPKKDGPNKVKQETTTAKNTNESVETTEGNSNKGRGKRFSLLQKRGSKRERNQQNGGKEENGSEKDEPPQQHVKAESKGEEEHEVRFVVGLLNGYLALKRLGAGDKDLTFSLANNKKKEEERERKELEKLRSEVVLRITSALTDLGVNSNNSNSSGTPSTTAATTTDGPPSGRASSPLASRTAAHTATPVVHIPTSLSAPNEPKARQRTSWRGRLRPKEKEELGKDKKNQHEPAPPAGAPAENDNKERRAPAPKSAGELSAKQEKQWLDLLSPRSLHKRSQSLTFEPQAAIEPLLGDGTTDAEADEPRIPLAELEERLRKMEELIDRKSNPAAMPATTTTTAVATNGESKKSKRRSINFGLRRSRDKAADVPPKESKKEKEKHKENRKKGKEEQEDDAGGSGECAIPASIYTKVTNRRRSVYHFTNMDSLREMISSAQQHSSRPDGPLDEEDLLDDDDDDDDEEDDNDEDDDDSNKSDDVMLGSGVKIVFSEAKKEEEEATPASSVSEPLSSVPSLNLEEVKTQPPAFNGYFLLSPQTQAPQSVVELPVKCLTGGRLSAAANGKSESDDRGEASAVAAAAAMELRRRTVHDKRDKMLRLRVIDSKFGPAKNVKWAFLWCEENVAPATLAKVVRAQAIAKRFLARRLRKRLQIANELLVTEEHYVDILDLLVKVFLQPLRASSLLPHDKVAAIFGNTETLRDKHVTFHELLHKRVRDWMTFQRFGVGDIFYDHTDFLLGYTEYVNNFDNAMSTLAQCGRTSPDFAVFIRNCEARPECNLHDLPSLLITPIQRIPRYTMLLQDLQRHTPRAGLLEMALKKVKDIANYVNEQKRANENAVKMAELESRLVFDPKPKVGLCEVPTRKFIKEGQVLIQLGRRHFKECHVFLFTDLLLITKNEKDEDHDDENKEKEKEKEAEPKRTDEPAKNEAPRYFVKAAEPLNENPIEISPLPDFFLDKAKRFPLRLYFSSQRKEYRCVFMSQHERDDWLQRIVSAHASARRRPYSLLTVRRGFAASAGADLAKPG